jgi:polyphenol oxidase
VRLPPPFRAEGDHVAIELPGARVLFTTRRGGVSEGPYASLNLGLWTEDDPERVRANRARVADRVGACLAQGRQVHGADVRRVGEPPAEGHAHEPADGQATALAGVAPAVLVADCLPIALAAPGAAAMLHAGWRGLAGGVIEEGVAAVRELAGRAPAAAAIGPGAGGCCYEVGEEVHAHFAAYDARRGARNLDLAAVARAQLTEADEVLDAGLCTICDERFFSHRRDKGITGRQAGVVCRA